MGDIALIWDALSSSADLLLEDDDLASDEGLRTATILSIFTDRRANDDDPLPADDGDKRGWWGDEFLEDSNDRMGSRRWLLSRTTARREIPALLEAYDREALAWMLEDRVVSSFDVVAEIAGDRLLESITLHRPGKDPLSFKFAHAWDGEAAKWDGYVLAAAPSVGVELLTEAGDTLTTESGDTLILE